MKYTILLALLLLVPFAAKAQTPITRDQANQYYGNCVTEAAKTEQRFSVNSQKMFCGCTAAKMTESFTLEDMAAMTDPNNPNARTALNKMIVNIYAPCMEAPTRDYHYSTCISNPQVKILGGNAERVCSCSADKIAQHLKNNGARMFQDILARSPDIVDPMQALYEDPQFQQFAQAQLTSCLK